jgi:hypothetical protein
MRRRSFLVMVVGVLGTAGCSRVLPLANASASSEALAGAVLDALSRRDRLRLEALALNEREFRDHVWPDLPAARPERNLPFSYVWGDLHQKSNIRLADTLRNYGHTQYALKRVTFSGKTNYARYVVHRDAKFEVTDSSGGSTELRVCGSFIEKNGVWKVFSYVVDD